MNNLSNSCIIGIICYDLYIRIDSPACVGEFASPHRLL